MRFKLVFVLVILISCSKKEKYESVKLFGHAGNGLDISNSVYPEDSEQSIHLALAQNGCDGVEIDVQLSKDGTAWLFHFPNLADGTSVSNCINSMTDEELAKVTFQGFNDEHLMKLIDLELNGKGVVLDLRHANECENKVIDINQMKAQIELFHQKNLTSTIYLNTNYVDWLLPLNGLNLITCYSPSGGENLDLISSTYGVKTFIFKNQEITQDEVKMHQNKGNEIIIFEVRSPKGIRSALNKFPNVILTDDLKTAIVEKY